MNGRLATIAILVVGAFALLGATAQTDPRHDFDFEVGTWAMSPSGDTHVVERLWEGATIARLIIPKPEPHARGSLLTVYRPATRQWYIYWVDSTDGSVSAPLVGTFSHGIGTFVGPDEENGHHVLVRLVFSNITVRTFETVQSVSHDGGKIITSFQLLRSRYRAILLEDRYDLIDRYRLDDVAARTRRRRRK